MESKILKTNSPFNSKIKNRIVYHYCSVETMMSILSNHTLRATNIKKSNDYHEVVSCIPTFQKAFTDACQEFRSYYRDSAFDLFVNNFDLDNTIESLINNDSLTYYCVCFSEEKDLLSQWRGYADDAKGVAIGFDEHFFSQFTNYCHIKYHPIRYDRINICKDLKSYFLNQFELVKQNADAGPSDFDYINIAESFLSTMVYNAIFCKDDSFSEEREYRIVYYPFGEIRNLKYRNRYQDIAAYEAFYDRMSERTEYSDKYDKLVRKPIGFTWRNNVFSSYVDLDFGEYLPDIIPEIVLGPQCNIDDQDFRLFLLSSGLDLYKTKISHSKSSYR